MLNAILILGRLFYLYLVARVKDTLQDTRRIKVSVSRVTITKRKLAHHRQKTILKIVHHGKELDGCSDVNPENELDADSDFEPIFASIRAWKGNAQDAPNKHQICNGPLTPQSSLTLKTNIPSKSYKAID